MARTKTATGVLAASILLLASGAWAQNPQQDRDRGRFGPDPGSARFLGAQAGTPGRVVRSAPYSAEMATEVTQTLADGNHIRQVNSSRVFRDSEGRTRIEQSLHGLGALAPNSNLPTVVFLQDPVAGNSYALDGTRKTATRSAWARAGRAPGQKGPGANAADAGRPRGPRPPDQNVKTESLGRQTMEGIAVDGTRLTTTIPAGQIGNEQAIQIVTERWFSPDLQIFILTRHSDPRSGETVTRVTNLNRAEPAKALFEVPADFKVVEDSRAAGAGPASSK